MHIIAPCSLLAPYSPTYRLNSTRARALQTDPGHIVNRRQGPLRQAGRESEHVYCTLSNMTGNSVITRTRSANRIITTRLGAVSRAVIDYMELTTNTPKKPPHLRYVRRANYLRRFHLLTLTKIPYSKGSNYLVYTNKPCFFRYYCAHGSRFTTCRDKPTMYHLLLIWRTLGVAHV